jgi:RNA polymerase sigma-70 factor (ECF subfamily)
MLNISDINQLQALRPILLRFAQLQLRDTASAEDAVSETMLAVLEQPERFAGASSLKTYVIGILKHKLIDHLRRSKRTVALDQNDDEGEADHAALLDELFDQSGHYVSVPPNWGNPDYLLEQKQFFDILQICVDRLPEKLSRLFLMREWLELGTDHICSECDVTENHLGVLLFRARLRLRECLQASWFDAHPAMPAVKKSGIFKESKPRKPRAS